MKKIYLFIFSLIVCREVFTSTHITVFFSYSGFSIGLTGHAGESIDGDIDKEQNAAIDSAHSAKKHWDAKPLPAIEMMMEFFKTGNHPYKKNITWIDLDQKSKNRSQDFHFPDEKNRVAIAINLKPNNPPSTRGIFQQFQVAQFMKGGPGLEIFKKWGAGESFFRDEILQVAHFASTHRTEVEKEKLPEKVSTWDQVRFFKRQIVLKALDEKNITDELMKSLISLALTNSTDWRYWEEVLILTVRLTPSIPPTWIKLGDEIISGIPKPKYEDISADARKRVHLQEFALMIDEDQFYNEIIKDKLESKFKYENGSNVSASSLFTAEAIYRAALSEIEKKNNKLASYLLSDLNSIVPHYKNADQLKEKIK